MYNGRRLTHGAVDRRQVGHVQVRGNHDGRGMGLELSRGHRILMVLRLDVRVHAVPLRLRRIWRRVRSIVRLRVCGVGIVMHGRMGLWRRLVVLVVVAMPPSRMERDGRRYRVTRHHGEGAVAFTVGRRPETKQRNV